jgi:N-acetylmuramoyl-L-alanine amidase
MKKAVITALAAVTLCSCSAAGSGAIKTSAPVTAPDGRPTVVIDAGHGGEDGGGVSVNGIPEKGMNLDMALKLSDMLSLCGYNTVMTRTEDVSIYDSGVEGLRKQKLSDMENRLELFNTEGADCISIHQNRFTDPKYSGAQMFYHKENPEGGRLAECLRARIRGDLQPDNERETKAMDDELYLLCNCRNPAVMAECGFISNPEEAAKLEQETYRRQMAFALFSGLNDYHIDSGRIEKT